MVARIGMPCSYAASSRVGGLLLLAAGAHHLLDDLQCGTPLTGLVKAHHRRKLFLSVPVQRRAKGGALKPVTAYVSLPPSHEFLTKPDALIGHSMQWIEPYLVVFGGGDGRRPSNELHTLELHLAEREGSDEGIGKDRYGAERRDHRGLGEAIGGKVAQLADECRPKPRPPNRE